MSRVYLVVVCVVAWCLSGCSALVDNHECPGVSCTDALGAVSRHVADLPRVTEVGTVGRYDDLESDPSGLVEVTAAVVSLDQAQDVAADVLDTWKAGDVQPVHRLEIHVRPEHPQVEPRVIDFTEYGGDGSCSGSCRSLLTGLASRARQLGADPLLVGRDHDDRGRAVWTWRLRARAVQRDPMAASALANRLLDAARAAGVGAPISMWLDYRAPETFSFSWKDGEGMSVSP